MELFWIIYLIGMFSSILGVASAVIIALMVLTCLGAMVASVEGLWAKAMPGIKMSLKVIAALGFVIIVVPSKSTGYKMLAAYGVTEAYTAAQESDKVQAIAGKSLKVLEKAMDSYLDEEVK